MRIGSISFRRLDSTLIESLRNPQAYNHPVQSLEIIETHISWVILTGMFAYKIKKPVEIGFLDFRELSSRLFYCSEEVRLNRPWAPEIYLGVVPITMHAGQPVVGGDGLPIEFAVRMRQFDQEKRLDAELEANRLTGDDMDELAAKIAQQHREANVIGPGGRDESLLRVKNDMQDNLDALDGLLAAGKSRSLRQWTAAQLHSLHAVLQERFDAGFVRECHGDLHLSNLVRLPSGITAFDCIEFSDDLRNIDVMSDIALLIMDLASRRRSDLAYRFLNRYLELTGDYGSMELFELYFVYRSLVRAKVAAIRGQERAHDIDAADDLDRMRKYCDMALAQTVSRSPTLIIMHGLTGSGKTWLSSRLMSTLPAVRIRSDIERKRMFELEETAESGSGIAQGIYTEAFNHELYRRIHHLAAKILQAGHDVIVDASYLSLSERQYARVTAADCTAGFSIIHAHGPLETLRNRIRDRARKGNEASEANLAVLDYQLETLDGLTHEEQRATVDWNVNENASVEDLCRRLRARPSKPLAISDQH